MVQYSDTGVTDIITDLPITLVVILPLDIKGEHSY